MRTLPSAPLTEKLGEGGAPEPGHDAWVRAKVSRALKEISDPSNRIPADQVWRDLGLET